jgi:hypothetical protein
MQLALGTLQVFQLGGQAIHHLVELTMQLLSFSGVQYTGHRIPFRTLGTFGWR